MALTYLDLRAITCCEAARSGDDRQAQNCLLQRLALVRCTIIRISFPPIPWPMTKGKYFHGFTAIIVNKTTGEDLTEEDWAKVSMLRKQKERSNKETKTK